MNLENQRKVRLRQLFLQGLHGLICSHSIESSRARTREEVCRPEARTPCPSIAQKKRKKGPLHSASPPPKLARGQLGALARRGELPCPWKHQLCSLLTFSNSMTISFGECPRALARNSCKSPEDDSTGLYFGKGPFPVVMGKGGVYQTPQKSR